MEPPALTVRCALRVLPCSALQHTQSLFGPAGLSFMRMAAHMDHVGQPMKLVYGINGHGGALPRRHARCGGAACVASCCVRVRVVRACVCRRRRSDGRHRVGVVRGLSPRACTPTSRHGHGRHRQGLGLPRGHPRQVRLPLPTPRASAGALVGVWRRLSRPRARNSDVPLTAPALPLTAVTCRLLQGWRVATRRRTSTPGTCKDWLDLARE